MYQIDKNLIPQNLTDMVSNSIGEMAKVTSQALDVFLCEYCEVKKIPESKLKDYVTLGTTKVTDANSLLAVKEIESDVVLFRVTSMSVDEGCSGNLYYDFYLSDKERFPKTYSFIKKRSDAQKG